MNGNSLQCYRLDNFVYAFGAPLSTLQNTYIVLYSLNVGSRPSKLLKIQREWFVLSGGRNFSGSKSRAEVAGISEAQG